MEFVFGILFAVALVALAVKFLIGNADRTALFTLLFGRYLARPEVIPPQETAPALPPRPPLLYGNIPRIDAEADLPDLAECFVFPEKLPATVRYDDFNRRLVVFTVGAATGPEPLEITRISDEPIRLTGSLNYLERLIRTQFRPAYPTIIDHAGIFASHSAALERFPLHTAPAVRAVLDVEENQRPVIFSVLNSNQAAKTLQFIRYGFVDFHLDPQFLGQDLSNGLTETFDRLLGPAEEWMYFSRARLRHSLMLSDRKSAELQRQMAEQADNERKRRKSEEEQQEADPRFDSFGHLWALEKPATTSRNALEGVSPQFPEAHP